MKKTIKTLFDCVAVDSEHLEKLTTWLNEHPYLNLYVGKAESGNFYIKMMQSAFGKTFGTTFCLDEQDVTNSVPNLSDELVYIAEQLFKQLQDYINKNRKYVEFSNPIMKDIVIFERMENHEH